MTTDNTPALPTETTSPSTEPAPADTVAEKIKQLSGEAASWRKKLRDTETERDTLNGQLDAYRATLTEWKAAEVRTVLSEVVKNPATLTALGFNPSEYVNDDHTIDVDGARAAAAELRDTHGLEPAETGPSALAVEVAAEDPAAGIPAELLRGTTAAELRAHRDQLNQWRRETMPVMPVVAGEAAGGSGPITEVDWLRNSLRDM